MPEICSHFPKSNSSVGKCEQISGIKGGDPSVLRDDIALEAKLVREDMNILDPDVFDLIRRVEEETNAIECASWLADLGPGRQLIRLHAKPGLADRLSWNDLNDAGLCHARLTP